MSARSRALRDLADHMERLRDGVAGCPPKDSPALYNGWDIWDRAADMARRTALNETWRARIARLVSPRS